MYLDKPTISKEVQAMADAISIIANDDLLLAANPLTVELFATCFVWTYRDIWENYLWQAEDILWEKKYGNSIKG